jgi:hypothetical protein
MTLDELQALYVEAIKCGEWGEPTIAFQAHIIQAWPSIYRKLKVAEELVELVSEDHDPSTYGNSCNICKALREWEDAPKS